MQIEEKKRKVRSDKKRDVKPTISLALKECIGRISYITDTPVKNVAEAICVEGLNTRKVMELLSIHFRRNLRYKSTVYIGDLSRPSLQKEKINGIKERITIRFKEHIYEDIKSLSYSLDVTPTKGTAMLLDASIRNTDFVNQYVKKHLEGHLDPGRMKQLREVLQFINNNNPYEEEVSWGELISYIYDEVKDGATTLGVTISNWLDKFKE